MPHNDVLSNLEKNPPTYGIKPRVKDSRGMWSIWHRMYIIIHAYIDKTVQCHESNVENLARLQFMQFLSGFQYEILFSVFFGVFLLLDYY